MVMSQRGAGWTRGLVIQVCMIIVCMSFQVCGTSWRAELAAEVLGDSNQPFNSRNQWSRLSPAFVQAAVVDLLTSGDFPRDIDDRGVAEYIRTQFSNFVSGQSLNELDTVPKHEPHFYLRIWRSLDRSSTGPITAENSHLTYMEHFPSPALDPLALEPTSQVHSLKRRTRAAPGYSCPFTSV